MISETDTKRIKEDARIAIDMLSAIAYSEDRNIHEAYLEEKTDVVTQCINFMRSFL